jgi:hypothetical protein
MLQVRVLQQHIMPKSPRPPKFLLTEKHLGHALEEAFDFAHALAPDWADWCYQHLTEAGVDSINDLSMGCKEDALNLDLDFIECPLEGRLDNQTLLLFCYFLPGPTGLRCFRLSQIAVDRVEKRLADAKYVHRPESGLRGEERWHDARGDAWKLHVDYVGFVRSVLKHVLESIL